MMYVAARNLILQLMNDETLFLKDKIITLW